MRTNLAAVLALPVIGLVSASALAEPDARRDALDLPGYQAPAQPWRSVDEARVEDRRCHEAITRVRTEQGQPEIERQPASPEKPLFYKAVDRDVEGCPVLVMADDTSDVRPAPTVSGKDVAYFPAR